MIKFTTNLILKNKVLWAWPIFMIGFMIVTLIWGDIQVASNHLYRLHYGGAAFPAGLVMAQLISFIAFISIIGFPNHLSKSLESERASLIFSKAISRTDFLLADYAGMLIVALLYSIISVAAIAVLFIVKAGVFPAAFLFALLIFIPLLLLGYYISIVLFLLLTNSYLASVIIGYFVMGVVSSVLVNTDRLLAMAGYSSEWAQHIGDVLSYLVPSTVGVQMVMQSVLSGGFATLDGSMFVFVLTSFLPFLLLGFYLMQSKEF